MSKDVQPGIYRTKQENTLKSDANKIFKMYHISAPFEEPNTGDYDYCNKLNELINDYAPEFKKKYGSEIRSQYLKLSDLGVEEEDKMCISAIIYTTKCQQLIETLEQNAVRQKIIDKLLHYVMQHKDDNTHSILNLQLRPPDTGFLFIPGDIKTFKARGIAVNITCHEYKLNEERPSFQAILHDYFKEANSVTFFNVSDFTRAVKHADKSAFAFSLMKQNRQDDWNNNKFNQWVDCFQHIAYDLEYKEIIFTRVPPTIGYTEDITFEEFQQKKPNIIIFGTIRPNKGICEIIDIAKELQKRIEKGTAGFLKDSRIIVAGNVIKNKDGAELLQMLLLSKYSLELCKNVLGVAQHATVHDTILKILHNQSAESKIKEFLNQLNQEQSEGLLPIDIIIGPTPEEMKKIYAENKYAVKYDNKGWANNASSHIAPLVNNCIVYTAWGINSSEEVCDEKGSCYKSIQLLSDRKYGLKFGETLSLRQIHDGAKKKNFLLSSKQNKDKNRELVDAKRLLDDINLKESDDNLLRNAFIQSRELKKNFVDSAEKFFTDNLAQVSIAMSGESGEGIFDD